VEHHGLVNVLEVTSACKQILDHEAVLRHDSGALRGHHPRLDGEKEGDHALVENAKRRLDGIHGLTEDDGSDAHTSNASDAKE
jgi:hypothetical protein